MGKNEKLFQKGDNIFQYYIYPIYYDNYKLNSDLNEKRKQQKEHVLSIVYVISKNNINDQYSSFTPYIKFLALLYCFTFILIGSIILNCTSYGIFIISKNITQSIKDFKSRLKAGIYKKNTILKGIKTKMNLLMKELL